MALIPGFLWPRKKRGLYYLLPGMNRCNRQRRRELFKWSLLVGAIVSIVMGLLLYYVNSR